MTITLYKTQALKPRQSFFLCFVFSPEKHSAQREKFIHIEFVWKNATGHGKFWKSVKLK